MLITAGIDVGAANIKVAILNENKEILARTTKRSGSNVAKIAEDVFKDALDMAGIAADDVDYVMSTGFARYAVAFRDFQVTDLTAHGQGALYYFPGTRSAIDIGGQSTRAFQIEPNGRVKSFRTNDKCAAGSGTFLVRVARYLEVRLEELGSRSLESKNPQQISSICAVLAETEIINLVTAGAKVEDILKGVMNSLTDRAVALLSRAGIEPPIALTGGVARNIGMVKSLEERLGQKLNYGAGSTDESFYAGAVGAGLLALMRLKKTGIDRKGRKTGDRIHEPAS